MNTCQSTIQRPMLHISEHPQGYILGTDKNAMKTRGGIPVVVPTRPLAEALQQEWNDSTSLSAQGMPFFALTSFTLEVIQPERTLRQGEILPYLETDTLCYRSPEEAIAQRQQHLWEPYVTALESAWHMALPRTQGLMASSLPKTVLQQAEQWLEGQSAFRLAGVYQAAQVMHSFVLAWWLAEGKADAEHLFDAAYLEQRIQQEQWGEDAEAEMALQEKFKLLKNIETWFCCLPKG